MRTIAMIAAIQRHDRGLGFEGDLSHRISDDLKRFKALTLGSIVVMGRKTWESIPERFRPLPGRTNVVVTRNKDYAATGATVVCSVDEALAFANGEGRTENGCFVIGGAELYRQMLPVADRLYLTVIDAEKPSDVFFPDHGDFARVIEREQKTDAATGIGFEYVTLER